jgi:nitrate reductase alpha subunit
MVAQFIVECVPKKAKAVMLKERMQTLQQHVVDSPKTRNREARTCPRATSCTWYTIKGAMKAKKPPLRRKNMKFAALRFK